MSRAIRRSRHAAYGSAGWTSGDRSVLLYDKYDIWEVRPDGTDARLVTGGAGRKAQIVFRYVKTDPEERTIPADKAFLLSAVNDADEGDGLLPRDADGGRRRAGSEARKRQDRGARSGGVACWLRRAREARHARQASRQPWRRRRARR